MAQPDADALVAALATARWSGAGQQLAQPLGNELELLLLALLLLLLLPLLLLRTAG